MSVTPTTDPSQVVQCRTELDAIWGVLRRARTVIYLAAIYSQIDNFDPTHVVGDESGEQHAGKRDAIGDFFHQRTGRSRARRGNVLSTEMVDQSAHENIGDNDSGLGNHGRPTVSALVLHLGEDGEAALSARVGEP
jgi:hypothetical protein